MPTRTSKRRLTMAGTAAVVVLAGAVGANAAGDDGDRAARNTVTKVTLRGVDGSRVGWVSMRQQGDHVVVRGFAHGLAPGFHGFHIHTIGLCEADAPGRTLHHGGWPLHRWPSRSRRPRR